MEKLLNNFYRRYTAFFFFKLGNTKGILISNLTVNKKGKTAFTKFEIA